MSRAANISGKGPFSREQEFLRHFRRYGYFSKYLHGATDHWKALAKRARLPLPNGERQGNTAEAERGKARQAWMEERRPGWSLLEWERHTEAAGHKITYKTLKKWRAGVTTRKTPDIRNSLAKSEGVSFKSVPE